MHTSLWGAVYVIQGGVLYKIGYTYGPVRQRLSTLQTGSPIKLSLVCEIRAPVAEKLERALAERFHTRHVRGEWYRLTKQDIYYLQVEEAESHRRMRAQQMQETVGWQ
jgi:hypothetical protein